MIRHIVGFTLKPGLSAADHQTLLSGLRAFPKDHPQIQSLEIGRNSSRRDRTYDYILMMQFADEADLAAYLDSEQHEEFVRKVFNPLLARRCILSLDLGADEASMQSVG